MKRSLSLLLLLSLLATSLVGCVRMMDPPLNDADKPGDAPPEQVTSWSLNGVPLEDLISHLNPKGGRVYFTTCFWKSERVDSEIRRVAQKLQMPLLELGALGENEENMAVGLFEHRGVAHHPGDLGMQRIAEGLYDLMRK